MRSRLLMVAVAVVLGSLAAYLSVRYVTSARSEIAAQEQPIPVLVARAAAPKGSAAARLVSQGTVEVRQVPRRFVAEGALSSVSDIDGQVLTAALSTGEQLTAEKFRSPAEAGLAASIPKGYLAVAVPVDDQRGVAGLLQSGDVVAVTATFHYDEDDKALTRILLPAARVLAVGRTVGDGATEPDPGARTAGLGNAGAAEQDDQELRQDTVTLAVAPADVPKIVLALERGKVWLALLPQDGAKYKPVAAQTVPALAK